MAGQGSADMCRIRWAVDTGAWDPSDYEWERVLSLLPEPERAEVLRFRHQEDQRRALASRLMQRTLVSRVFNINMRDVVLHRTKGRKPFHAGPHTNPPHAPNLNYNVSHEGRFTVLASEPYLLVGVDVAGPVQARVSEEGRTLAEGLQDKYGNVLHNEEWAAVHNAGPDEGRVARVFQTLWSLKEAFIKARGDGLGFSPLSRACFHVPSAVWEDSTPAHLTLDGQTQDSWRFDAVELPHGHVMSVARGPPAAAVDALGEFRATFRAVSLSTNEVAEQLEAVAPRVTFLSIPELLSLCGSLA